MKIAFLFIIFFSFNAFSLEVAGTKAREEVEYKFAFEFGPNSPSLKSIGKLLQEKLKHFILKELHFPKLVKGPYYLNPQFDSFVFKDIYFDTYNNDLAKRNSAYRLRYRWTGLDKYHRYKILPWFSALHPDRCEIQFKWDYQFNKKERIVTVKESRFEFRNESMPFLLKQNAPPSPWKEKDFIEIGKKGVFEKWIMQPSQDLKKHLALGPEVFPFVTVETIRYRSHLNIKNPWGSGPNPDQAFIITIDSTYSVDKEFPPFIEIEIERERNTSDQLNEWAKRKLTGKADIDSIINFSQKAKLALKKDHQLLGTFLSLAIENDLKLKILPSASKYHRIYRGLQ